MGIVMGRLKTLPSRLGSLPSALGYMAPASKPAEAQRAVFSPWRAWYKTARWQKLRWSVLVRDLFTCQRPGCGYSTSETAQLVADHRTPHRGDERLFWDADNLQCLCKPCHDRHKQREERRGF